MSNAVKILKEQVGFKLGISLSPQEGVELLERINKLTKAVRILASEPHESVVSKVYADVFPDEIKAQEDMCKKLNTNK